MTDLYVAYSFSTDVTGMELANALGAKGNKGIPKMKPGDIMIGWGAKQGEVFTPDKLKGVLCINSPTVTKNASNKLLALRKMKEAKVAIPDFVEVTAGKLASKITHYPVIGRSKRHQGGKGFWLCLTPGDVTEAIKAGAEYFLKHINNVAEYRVHVFGKDIISIQRKEHQNNPHKTWVTEQVELAKKNAEKNEETFSAADAKATAMAYEVMLKKGQIEIPDPLIKSNHRGWKLTNINVTNAPANVVTQAKNAVKALDLDFGAVDCIVNENNEVFIVEVNTGPGLSDGTLAKYVTAFKEKINSLMPKKATPAPQPVDAPKAVLPKTTNAAAAPTLGGTEFVLETIGEMDDTDVAALIRFARKLAQNRKK